MQTPSRPLVAAFAGLGILGALAGCATTTDTGTSSDSTESDDTTSGGSSSDGTGTDATTTEDDTSSTATGSYADGTYEAEGSYQTPGGTSTVAVELTIEGDVVTAVTVTPEATNSTSRGFQEQFASGIADEIVGVALDDISVDRVSGSSLTSGGFTEALDAIKDEAAA